MFVTGRVEGHGETVREPKKSSYAEKSASFPNRYLHPLHDVTPINWLLDRVQGG